MKYIESQKDEVIEDLYSIGMSPDEEYVARTAMGRILDKMGVTDGGNTNWFQKWPIEWRYIYYMVGGVVMGLLIGFFW